MVILRGNPVGEIGPVFAIDLSLSSRIMGIIIIGSLFSGFVSGLIPGIGGLLLFRWLHNPKEGGTWRRYTLYACVGGLVLVGIGILQIPSGGTGAPSGAEYAGATSAAFYVGFAPGGGLLLGCLAALPPMDA